MADVVQERMPTASWPSKNSVFLKLNYIIIIIDQLPWQVNRNLMCSDSINSLVYHIL